MKKKLWLKTLTTGAGAGEDSREGSSKRLPPENCVVVRRRVRRAGRRLGKRTHTRTLCRVGPPPPPPQAPPQLVRVEGLWLLFDNIHLYFIYY